MRVGGSTHSWFRTPAGRLYYQHFGALLAAKLALLLILYFVFIAPQPRADTSPTAVFSALVHHDDAGQQAAPR
jgi:hypothetical protein